MKRRKSVSVDGAWDVKDGWLSRKRCAKPNNISMPYTPKMSSIRYAAMKSIQLPPEKNLKQTKIAFPIMKKSNKVEKSSTILSLKVPSPIDHHLSIKSAITSVDEHTRCSRSSASKENQSDAKHLQQEYNHCFTVTPFKSDVTPSLPITVVQRDWTNISPNVKTNKGCLETNIERPISLQASSLCSEPASNQENHVETYQTTKLHSLQTDNPVHHQVDCCQAPIPPHYDLTMKFVPDSQGNQIFDRFTQKLSSDTGCSLELLTDTEQELYKNFANGLLGDKECQSTQIV